MSNLTLLPVWSKGPDHPCQSNTRFLQRSRHQADKSLSDSLVMVKTESCALGWRELTLPLMWVSSPPPPTACCHPMNSIHSQQANYSRTIHNSLWMGNWVGSVLFLPSDHESFTFELQLPREKQWLKNCVADSEAYFICGCPEPHCLQILWSTSVTENLLA